LAPSGDLSTASGVGMSALEGCCSSFGSRMQDDDQHGDKDGGG